MKQYEKDAEKFGFVINYDNSDKIDKLLDTNKELHGERYCPCEKIHTKDTICPCKKMRETEICKCNLFL